MEQYRRVRDAIAADNLGLVYHLYSRSRLRHLDGDEVISDGMAALARAIDTFDPQRGFRFSTYACSAINRAFYRCSMEALKRRRRTPVAFETQCEHSDWLDTRRAEAARLYAERLTTLLASGCADLTPAERDVLTLRFPLEQGMRRETLAAIGARMHLSKERIRQIEKSGLSKLRTALEADPILR